MLKLFKIAIRNLMRYKRRTLLTASLITMGVVFVLVFVSVSSSLKNMMIGQVTDSFLGHIQIHRKGYVASIESLPLTMNLGPQAIKKVEKVISEIPEIDVYSIRIKFCAYAAQMVPGTTGFQSDVLEPEDTLLDNPASGRGTHYRSINEINNGSIYLHNDWREQDRATQSHHHQGHFPVFLPRRQNWCARTQWCG